MHWFLKFIFGIKLYLFGTVPLSIIRRFSLYDVYHDSEKPPDDGRRNCPKHVEFYSKNKFEKLVYLLGFFYKNLSRCTVTWTSNEVQIYLHALFV